MTNTSAEVVNQKPSAVAKSAKFSLIVSFGKPAQTKTTAEEPPIIMARISRVLLGLYFIVSHEEAASYGGNQPLRF